MQVLVGQIVKDASPNLAITFLATRYIATV